MPINHIKLSFIYIFIGRSTLELSRRVQAYQMMEKRRQDSYKLKIQSPRTQQVYLKRKQLCSLHSLRYRYKCMFTGCSEPFTCGKQECMEGHFHKGMLSLTKFNSDSFRSKCQSAQKMINTSQKIHSQARILKFTVQGMINCLTKIYKDLALLNNHSQLLKKQLDQQLAPNYVQSVHELIQIQSNINEGINLIRKKIIHEAELKDSPFLLKQPLISFLKDQIPNFNWDNCIQIWSSRETLTTCQKFHQKLQKKDHLLYLFIDQHRIIGSYYPDTYPTLTEKIKKSPESFIFIAESEKASFIKFYANKESEYHMQISEKLLVCQGNSSNGDGLRTFANNFDVIDYFFPSLSYLSTQLVNVKQDQQIITYYGQMKPKIILILQVNNSVK